MRRVSLVAIEAVVLLGITGCYRLPLHIRENDAAGYEDVGVPMIEAVEYTPAGRELRVVLDAPGYVTVILVDPEKGATVRFRRGELQSRPAVAGVHRYPLDRLASPMSATQYVTARTAPRDPLPMGRPTLERTPMRMTVFDPVPVDVMPSTADSRQAELRLVSRRLATSREPIRATHVVVLVSERPLDLVSVALRLATAGSNPMQVAQAAADVVEGGRWMAAVAPLRGQ